MCLHAHLFNFFLFSDMIQVQLEIQKKLEEQIEVRFHKYLLKEHFHV